MSTNIDWPAIRAGYESGISQNTLAREYGITQQAISKRRLKEGWTVQFVVPPTTSHNFKQPTDDKEPNDNETTLDLVEKALRSLAKHLELADGDNLDLKSHKLFADSLSQYVKLKFLLPNDKPTESGLPADVLKYLTMEDLSSISEHHAEIDATIERGREKKLEAEQGIKTIRKSN